MGAPDRFVLHLRLRVGSEDELGHMLPRIEDALRCASLPDTGERVLLVRRLALGRIERGISSQSLSRLIEERLAQTDVQWVPGGAAAAEQAAFVSFADRLQARTLLALKLVRGEPCSEWYWPLAVPEFRAAAGRAANLQCIAEAIARLPEARVALPAWAAALVRARAADGLTAFIDSQHGETLLRHAGVAILAVNDDPRRSQAPQNAVQEHLGPGTEDGVWHREGNEAASWPRWLHSLLVAGGAQDLLAHRTSATRPARVEIDRRAAVAPAAEMPRAPMPWDHIDNTARPAIGRDLAESTPKAGDRVRADTAPALSMPEKESRPMAVSTQAEPTGPWLDRIGARLDQPPFLEPSAAGGLLFVLPVLARLGAPAWLAQAESAGEFFVHRVLKVALQRLDVPMGDPAWVLVAAQLSDAAPLQPPAPPSWCDPLLAAPRRATTTVSLTHALASATSANAQAALWLTAVRRWLRRGGHIGLASLVLRYGVISLTRTHADVHFRVDDADMRVRRAGLDLDPGWLPWFGRVVAFHYREGTQ